MVVNYQISSFMQSLTENQKNEILILFKGLLAKGEKALSQIKTIGPAPVRAIPHIALKIENLADGWDKIKGKEVDLRCKAQN
jgi:hypothetical protein